MNIIKCKCSNYIHVFPLSGNFTCFICGNSNENKKTINKPFDSPFLSLNDKLSETDKLINSSNYKEADKILNEVLDIAPGPKIGELKKTGEIYWRKLLIDVNCNNDIDLLVNGKSLHEYSAFNNAVKYSFENEKQVYLLIEQLKNNILIDLKKEMKKQELIKKQEIDADNLLEKYREEFDKLHKQAQENIKLLEESEKEIHEHIIDYSIVTDEFKFSLEEICIKIRDIINKSNKSNKSEDALDINIWQKNLAIYLSKSRQENEILNKLKYSNEHYIEYSRLTEKQKILISEINATVSCFNNLKKKIESCIKKIQSITGNFKNAFSSLEEGDYVDAIKLITKARFDSIFDKTLKKI